MPRWLFAVLVLAVLQLLLWVFARSLRFLWGDTRRRWLTATVFVAGVYRAGVVARAALAVVFGGRRRVCAVPLRQAIRTGKGGDRVACFFADGFRRAVRLGFFQCEQHGGAPLCGRAR